MDDKEHPVGENMTYIMVDIETDGPIPVDYSMICFGAIVVSEKLDKRFYGQIQPISDKWIPEALKISGFSREETLQFPEPGETMTRFLDWIKESVKAKPIFISDNNGYDWQFINYYFHHFSGSNPFGYSSTNLGSLYKGLVKDTAKNFKHLRKTKHTHDPLDDVIGNAEALLHMKKEMGLKINV
jgi:DNA polymerase III epsilon subunit-like protein